MSNERMSRGTRSPIFSRATFAAQAPTTGRCRPTPRPSMRIWVPSISRRSADMPSATAKGLRHFEPGIYAELQSELLRCAVHAWVEDNETRKFSQELRFSGALSERVDWMVGGFYTDETTDLTGRPVRVPGRVWHTTGIVVYLERAGHLRGEGGLRVPDAALHVSVRHAVRCTLQHQRPDVRTDHGVRHVRSRRRAEARVG